jgi:CheY-like chemotaxis protein
MKILLADDDADVLYVAESALRKLGHDVVATENGSEAFDLYRTERFDVVVCDLAMPGLDGDDLCRSIRAMC